MTPDPAPYGADLPREIYWSGDYADALAALDAANAEVLRLRAERDALLADLAGVLGREATLTVRCERAEAERDAMRLVVEAVRAWAEAQHQARDLLALLPAPTEGDG